MRDVFQHLLYQDCIIAGCFTAQDTCGTLKHASGLDTSDDFYLEKRHWTQTCEANENTNMLENYKLACRVVSEFRSLLLLLLNVRYPCLKAFLPIIVGGNNCSEYAGTIEFALMANKGRGRCYKPPKAPIKRFKMSSIKALADASNQTHCKQIRTN